MSAEMQRLATLITQAAVVANELAHEVPFLAINHNCVTGRLEVHVRSLEDLARVPGEAHTITGELDLFTATKQYAGAMFFSVGHGPTELAAWLRDSETEVAGNED